MSMHRTNISLVLAVVSVLLLGSEAFSASTATAPSIPTPTSSEESTTDSSTSKKPRPLFQNWWPVSLESALDPSKPNAVELLSQKLVLFFDGTEWKCLDDACRHRFAPLSEGRLVNSSNCNHIQCAYHGWEFDGKGACQRIPQQSLSSSTTGFGKQVANYPVRVGGDMVWVWSDSNKATWPIAESVPLPISPLLEKFKEDYPGSGFMRDLPYGLELLGENLLDISHLPFSHHSVGGFYREDARPLKLQMLSEKERLEFAQEEMDAVVEDHDGYSNNGIIHYPVPIFQVQVQNASQSDPTLMARNRRRLVESNSTAVSGFYDPCHIRYRRIFGGRRSGSGANIELFISPISPGRSRVFFFNSFERFLQRNLDKSVQKRKGWFAKAKQRFINSRIRVIVGGSGWEGHMVAHDIFDGDGIFLNKQGDRMRRRGLTHKDYFTPTSTDILVKSYRRWLDAAAGATVDMYGLKGMQAATAATGSGSLVPNPSNEKPAYLDIDERAKTLDRFTSHTKNCKICSRALDKLTRRKSILDIFVTAMLGSVGASTSAFSVASLLALLGKDSALTVVARAVSRSAATIALASCVAFFLADRKRNVVAKQIQKFFFVDYVHSNK